MKGFKISGYRKGCVLRAMRFYCVDVILMPTQIHAFTSLQTIAFAFPLSLPEATSSGWTRLRKFLSVAKAFKAKSRPEVEQCWTVLEWLSNKLSIETETRLSPLKSHPNVERKKSFFVHIIKNLQEHRKLRGKRIEKTMKSETLFDQKKNFYLISLSLPFKLNLDLLLKCFSSPFCRRCCCKEIEWKTLLYAFRKTFRF